MSAEQPMDDGLAASQVRFDLETRSEPAMNSALATAERPHEIKIDASHRGLNAPASSDSHIFYVALTAGLLATFGLAWIILNGSALPFDLASVSGSAGNRHLDPKVSSSLEQNSNAPSAPMPDTQKVDRPQIHDTTVGEIGRNAPGEVSRIPNLSSASVGTTPLSPPATKHSTVAPRHTSLTGARAEESPTKRTSTPETRPTTIKGWMLREVTNGTAVLQGPNGVVRATPGQTVPGVGRVDSIVRWGNRFIVATSRGLISTP